jgi:hypothetical protein
VTYLSATSTRTGNSPGTYTTIYSNAQGIGVDLSCYNIVSGGWIYSMRGKAPTGTWISGFANEYGSSALSGVTGTANGSLTELTTAGQTTPKQNSATWYLNVLGPDIDPVHLTISVSNSTNCEVRGFAQVGTR